MSLQDSIRLNPANPGQAVHTAWPAEWVAILNPTTIPVYVRLGGPDIPSNTNYDLVVPAASAASFPVTGRSFGVAFDDVTKLTASGIVPGLSNTAIVIFGAGSIPPALGMVNYQTVPLSYPQPTNLTWSILMGATKDFIIDGLFNRSISLFGSGFAGNNVNVDVELGPTPSGPWTLLQSFYKPIGDTGLIRRYPLLQRYMRIHVTNLGAPGVATGTITYGLSDQDIPYTLRGHSVPDVQWGYIAALADGVETGSLGLSRSTTLRELAIRLDGWAAGITPRVQAEILVDGVTWTTYNIGPGINALPTAPNLTPGWYNFGAGDQLQQDATATRLHWTIPFDVTCLQSISVKIANHSGGQIDKLWWHLRADREV